MVILSFVLCLRAESIFVKQITFFYRIGCIRPLMHIIFPCKIPVARFRWQLQYFRPLQPVCWYSWNRLYIRSGYNRCDRRKLSVLQKWILPGDIKRMKEWPFLWQLQYFRPLQPVCWYSWNRLYICLRHTVLNNRVYWEFCKEILYALEADTTDAIEESYLFYKNGFCPET